MEIHHLKIFVFVYKHKSFTKASQELHISQPTISEHIKNLEKSLGCQLFDRLGRSILATTEADILYPRALKILDDLDKLQDDLTSTGEQVTGNITIGASTIPGTYILPALAVGFKKEHPDISFEIQIGDTERITELVLNHELLCGIVGAYQSVPKLTYTPFLEDELILVSAAGALPGRLKAPGKLYSIPFLIRELGSGTRKIMEAFLEQADIDIDRLNIVATLGSTAAVKEALKSGLGASILSRLAVEEELHSGKLQEVKLADMEMKRSFYIIQHKKRTLPVQYQGFVHYLRKMFPW